MNTFKWDEENSHWFVDQKNKMMLEKSPDWNKFGDEGRGDSIGRTMEAFFVWGDYRFIEGIESCWKKVPRKNWIGRLFKGKYYYQGYRYPEYYLGQSGISRDHTLNSAIAYKLAGKSDEEIWEFVKHLRWKISDDAKMTIDLWFFLRMLSGRKIAKWISPRLSYRILKFTSWWQHKVQKFIGFGPDFEEDQDTFQHMKNEDKPKCIKELRLLLHPVYSLLQLAWQSSFYNDKWKKKIQQVIYSITPRYNYVIKLLIGYREGITEEDILSYESMKGGRWDGIMNVWWNDRSLEINKDLDSIQYNVLDVDIIKKLWEEYENS